MENRLKQFIAKWQGKKLEAYDSQNLYQCYDLITAWCQELGLKPPLTLHAYQIFLQDYTQFDKIKNEATSYPQLGDIVVWGKSYNGTSGHTAVATGNHKTEGKSTDWFEAFSQNDPVGSPCIIKKYNYNYVVGWLRPKKEFIKSDYYKGIDLTNLESIKVCVDTWHQVAVEGLFVRKSELDDAKETINNLNQQINSLNANNTQINNENKRLAKELKDCQLLCQDKSEQYNNLHQELEILRGDIVKLEKLKADWQLKEIDLNKRIKFLETKLEGHKKPVKDLIVDIWLKVIKG